MCWNVLPPEQQAVTDSRRVELLRHKDMREDDYQKNRTLLFLGMEAGCHAFLGQKELTEPH